MIMICLVNASSCTVELWIHVSGDILGGLLTSSQCIVMFLILMSLARAVEFRKANILTNE